MAEKNKKKTPIGKIILFIVELLALAALVVLLIVVVKVTDKKTGVSIVSIENKPVTVSTSSGVETDTVMKGYRNIALFGVDSRKGDLIKGTRSDTIIIASINLDTKEVKLVSVYRDTYLNLMGNYGTYNKCNIAYKSGGGQQGINMLNTNLDLNIDGFVTIGFEGLRDVIDALGGVYIDVDAGELKHINNYQIEMVEKLEGLSESDYIEVKNTGYQLLNGLQATAYCRIRYTSGGDYKRTERQREVIKACLEVAKTASATTLIDICNNVIGEVCTSLDVAEITSLLKDVTSYSIVGDEGFPNSKMITTAYVGSKGDCVIPLDLESNVAWLHEYLFDEKDYVPSETVKEISQKIYDDTNKYIK